MSIDKLTSEDITGGYKQDEVTELIALNKIKLLIPNIVYDSELNKSTISQSVEIAKQSVKFPHLNKKSLIEEL